MSLSKAIHVGILTMRITCYLVLGLTASTWVSAAQAAVCDYRPSAVLGSAATTSTATIAGGAAALGAGAKAAGVYTLVHASSGLTMVGGTWAGASAAGTAGIIAGTGGVVGSTVAVLTAPATIVAGAAAAIGIGAFEGACYFTDTKITDYDEVDAIVRDIAVTAPPRLYEYFPAREGRQDAVIRVRDPDFDEVRFDDYEVKNLYISNGVLRYRKIGLDRTIGIIGQITGQDSGS